MILFYILQILKCDACQRYEKIKTVAPMLTPIKIVAPMHMLSSCDRISQLLLLLILLIFLDFLVSLKVPQFRFDGLRREGQQMSYQEYWFNFEAPFNGIYLMLLYKLIFKLLFRPTTWDQEWLQICHDTISQNTLNYIPWSGRRVRRYCEAWTASFAGIAFLDY